VLHGELERLQASDAISELLTLEKFAPKYHGRVSMIHPDGRAIDVESGKEALPYLQKGFTVYFRHVEKYFPNLQPILNKIAADTGMPPNEFTAEIFTSSGESGVPMHCDYDYNISLLLSGSKEWTFAENTGILNQTSIFMPANREQIEPSQLQYRTTEPQLESMPATSQKGPLRAGSLIFMPRGWWHTTRSIGDCLCINFVMKGPHYARLFASALEKELLPDSEWREYPYDIARTDGREEKSIQKLTKKIEEFKSVLNNEDSHETALRLLKRYLQN
jgi:ribosomal protein L16 Arg81 hydroxylase